MSSRKCYTTKTSLLLVAGCMATTPMHAQLLVKTAEMAAETIRAGDAAGGVQVTSGCEVQPRSDISMTGSTIVERLNSLQTSVSQLRWEHSSTGYTVVIGEVQKQSLMNIALPAIEIDEADLDQETEEILTSPRVDNFVATTHLKLFSPPLGYSHLPNPGATKVRIRIPAGTVAEDLNYLAQITGARVWLYSSNNCSGNYPGRIVWYR